MVIESFLGLCQSFIAELLQGAFRLLSEQRDVSGLSGTPRLLADANYVGVGFIAQNPADVLIYSEGIVGNLLGRASLSV